MTKNIIRILNRNGDTVGTSFVLTSDSTAVIEQIQRPKIEKIQLYTNAENGSHAQVVVWRKKTHSAFSGSPDKSWKLTTTCA